MAPSERMEAKEIEVLKSGRDDTPNLRILHFNDVYRPIAGSEDPVGGIARFQTLINYYRHDERFEGQPEALTLFSGDAFNPSRESTVTKGSHMVPVLNNIGIDAACIGNHEFDFGEAHFRMLAEDCEFPWLLGNLLDPNLGEDVPFGRCSKTVMLERNDLKIGVVGLVEREWLDKINNSLPASIEWQNPNEQAEKLCKKLREDGADIVIALTHMRQPRDFDFCGKLPEGLIDIVLGGHDHVYEHHTFDNGLHFLRSGTDFKNLSYLEARKKKNGKGWEFDIVRRDIVHAIPEHEETDKMADRLVNEIHRKLGNRIGYAAVPLEARFNIVGTKEANYGNFVADIMRLYYESDIALVTAFTFQGDQVYPTGELLLKDLIDCFPFEDPVVVLKITGKAVKEALENGVSKYPDPDGRFPQVSGMKFSFDGNAKTGQRITSVEIKGEKLDESKTYTIACRAFLASGKNGYEALRAEAEGGHAEEVVSEEEGILISALLRSYFTSLEIIENMKRLGNIGKSSTTQWDNITRELHDSHSVHEPSSGATKDKRSEADDSDDDEDTQTAGMDRNRKLKIMRKVMKKWRRIAGVEGESQLASSHEDGEFTVGWTKGIAPKLDGRIQMVSA